MSDPGAERAYDVIVIGMGPVGVTAAEGARAAGLSVAAVERELVGGECSYWACIPSKAMLRPVVAVADARRVAGAQEAVTGLVNPEAVLPGPWPLQTCPQELLGHRGLSATARG
jgi:pyruvate/2-oxoglutarate dehydrogenase complex dihydrolipoamide dehydrogenase (E3) component